MEVSFRDSQTDRFMTLTVALCEPGNMPKRDEGLDYDTGGVFLFWRLHLTPDALEGHRQVLTRTAGATPPSCETPQSSHSSTCPLQCSRLPTPTANILFSSHTFTTNCARRNPQISDLWPELHRSTSVLQPLYTLLFPALKSYLLFCLLVTSG